MALKGGKVKSIKSLKAGLKKGGGDGQYLFRVPKDGSVTVRFITEPDEWIEYSEHYDESKQNSFPCSDDCAGCKDNIRASKRYLVNAVDTADNKVVPLAMPKSLAANVMKKYEKFNTLLDRDYELTREGSGLETTYDCIPESPSRMNLKRFETLDLWALLEAQLPSADEEDDEDDEDDEDTKPVRRPNRGTGKGAPRGRTIADDDDDDEDEEDDEPIRKPRKKIAKPVRKPLRNRG